MKRVLAIALWTLSISLSAQVVTSAEFFWGATDPGQGSATALSAADGSFDEAVEEVIKTGISLPSTNGIHLFNIRVKDEDGNWGPAFKKAISIENSLTLRDVKLTGAEFFWGTSDPGEGSGTALLAFDNAFDQALETVFKSGISLPSTNGIHLFNIRVKDEDGNWGPAFKKAISIENSLALRDLKVTAVEYFWGLNDPGDGNGSIVLALDNAFDEAMEFVFKSGVYPPLAGWNLFNIRAADEEGNWGPVFKKPIWTDEGTNPIQIQLNQMAAIPCNGGQDAEIYATIEGGVEPYTINWSNSETNDTVKNLVAGKYIITVTDSTGLSNKDSIVITEPNALTITTTSTTAVTCSGNDGAATFSVSGGTSVYYVSWSGGISGTTPSNTTGNGYTFSISNVAPGTYTATITDENGCSKTHTVTIPVDPNTLTISTVGTDPTCYASTDGSIAVSTTSGQSPLTYLWSTGATSNGLTTLASGTYWLSVTDDNNCTRTDTIELTDPIQPSAPLLVTSDPSCVGSNGVATITNMVSGTTYTWFSVNGGVSTTIGNTASLSGLSSGNYTVNGIDANGCSTQGATFVLTGQTENLTISTSSQDDVSCFGASDGFVNVAINGGTAPYSYGWNNGNTGSALTGIGGGNYTVVVTDANGCTDSTNVTVNEPIQALDVFASATTALSCNGDTNASITVNTSGAQGAATYAWSNGSSGNNISGLSAGTYTVTATDGNNCQATQSISVMDPTAVTEPILTTANPTCGGSNGTAVVSNTQPNTTYAWYNGSSASSFSNNSSLSSLATGTYSVIATDLDGCQSESAPVTLVDQTAAIAISADTLHDVSCFNGTDGFINVAVAGGVAPYVYAWNSGGNGSVLTNAVSGTYTVVVTDNNGCIDSTSISLTEPSQAIDVVTLSSGALSCYSDSNASITVSTTGAQGAVNYSWSNGSTGQQLSGLTAGSYTVTALDSQGCSTNETVTITAPNAPLSSSLTGTTRDFCGSSSGTLTVSGAGGTSPYLYSWNTGSSLNTVTNRSSGAYTVTVTDVNGCTQSDTYNVADSTALITTNAAVQNTSCASASNGSITIQNSGGIAPYSYAWSSSLPSFIGSNTNALLGLESGDYFVTITDNFGCAKQDTVSIGSEVGLLASISNPNGTDTLDCYNTANGSLLANSVNGSGSLTYSWSNSENTALVNGLSNGVYWVTVTDSAGCSDSDTLSLYAPTALSLNVTSALQSSGYAINCIGDTTGSLQAQASGGTGAYSWNWSNGAVTPINTGLIDGVYWVSVQDSKGCIESDTINITKAPASIISSNVVSTSFGVDILCHGDSTGMAFVNITSPINILWDNGEVNDTALSLYAGTHYVQITDSLGCVYTDTVMLSEAAPITSLLQSASSYNGYDISCYGANDGSVNAVATGGLGTLYAWNWNNGNTGASINGVSSGYHIITVTDQAGCSTMDSIYLTEPDSLGTDWSIQSPLCFNTTDGSAVLAMYGGAAPYNWFIDGVNTGAVVTSLGPGNYFVSVSDVNGCSFEDTLAVNSPDSIKAVIAVTMPSCAGSFDGEINLSATGGTGTLYYYLNNVGTNGLVDQLNASTFLVEVSDDNGCSLDTVVELVALRDECLEVPNYFSPNNDGINDTWNILGIDLGNYNLIIFNVTGQELYRTDSQSYQPWSGMFNGRTLPDGDYYYVLESEINQRTGYVTLRK